MKRAILIISFLLFPATLYAMDSGRNAPLITDLPDVSAKVHDESNAYFTITNFGIIGSYGGNYDDPDWEGLAPGVEFPAGSEKDYLFAGALWIGAEIDTVDENGNPVIDTLVSIGADGWWGIFELFPPPPGQESLWEDVFYGDQEYYALYSDTLTDPSVVVPDPFDQRPHVPLGLSITQNSLCWASAGYDEVFIINFDMENISERDLHNVWIGIFYDGDVFHISEAPALPEQGSIDDLTGFIENEHNGVAWLADNNGQPYDGEFDFPSVTDVIGISLLAADISDLQINYNWWMSSIDPDLDWGPQLQSNFDIWGPFPGGGRGTPGGDKAKYQIMSNGERDYDQIWAALDHTDQGWIANPPNAEDFANGYDTRYLLSFGTFDLPAGDTTSFTISLVAGNDLHVDPDNYEQYLRYNTSDSISIDQYYRNLDFADLIAKSDSAFSFHSHDYSNIPLGPPHAFHIDDWSGSRIDLKWEMAQRPNLLEYRIYRGTQPGVYNPDKITPDGFIDSTFIDTDVIDNTTYYYVIASASPLGAEGGYSHEISVNSGQPHAPTGLTATSRNVEINLDWDDNPDNDISGYIIYKADIYHDFAAIDTSAVSSFTDDDLLVGEEYQYRITAVDTDGNESNPSDPVTLYAMGLDYGVLLVMSNRQHDNPDYDSMAVFYENALQNYPHLLVEYQPQSMPLLASFSTVIYAREQISGWRYFDLYDNENLMADYLEAGGNLILAGTRQVTPTNAFSGLFNFLPSDFAYSYLNLGGVEFPDVFNTEFVGGDAVEAPFDDFSLDTVRVNRIPFPPGDHEGRLPGIGVLIPLDDDGVIYNYRAVNPDTSLFDGRPVAFIHHTDTYSTAVIEVPLFYVLEPGSFDLVRQLLEDFGEIPVGIDPAEPTLPEKTELLQNYPNPFNSTTVFKYRLADPGRLQLAVYNILGQKVSTLVNGEMKAGEHKILWNAGSVPSGVYFARLITEKERKSVKLLLLK